ncbi:hypothetical protein LC040_09755 [Bacillus tianshenii]|nr:hypothetical protein LC040_09755 [Bacillus tianshenii]
MPRKTYDDQQLESLLKQLPKVEDKRSADEIYAQLSNKLDENPSESYTSKRKKKYTWLYPSIAAAVAVVLLAILVPSLMKNTSNIEMGLEQAAEDRTASEEELEEHAEIAEAPKAFDKGTSEEKNSMARSQFAIESAILPSHTLNVIPPKQKLVVKTLIDQNLQYVVPIAKTVPEDAPLDQALNEFDVTNDEADQRFSSEFLEDVTFKQTSKTVMQVTLTREHPVLTNSGSTGEYLFIETLKEMFTPLPITTLELRTEDVPGVDFAHYGPMSSLDVKQEPRKYYVTEGSGAGERPYLASLPADSNSTLLETLQEIEEKPIEQTLASPFPQGVTVDSVEGEKQGEIVSITFTNRKSLENSEKTILLLESVLMTAKSYGYKQVQFKQMPFKMIGNYNLTKPIPVPYAANQL